MWILRAINEDTSALGYTDKHIIYNGCELEGYIYENNTYRKVEVDEYGFKETAFDDDIDTINLRTHVLSNQLFDSHIIREGL